MPSFNYTHDDLLNPCIQAFHNLGGSGTNTEVEEQVIQILSLSEDEINEIHRGDVTRFTYRLAWARTYLKMDGILENPSRSVWALTAKGQKTQTVDKNELKKRISKLWPNRGKTTKKPSKAQESIDDADIEWREELSSVLGNMKPDAFERLSQRLLRELGFENVEVTGRSGDGGIDGKGQLKIGPVVTFSVVFQCKRYKGSVSTNVIRDFRGAFQGRADKGLVITTGRFTRSAKLEAQRDGALAIDLIDGNELIDMLKDYKLGVQLEKVEKVTIDREWFDNR